MINSEMAWPLIKTNALKALKVNLTWHSLVRDRTYQLAKVEESSLTIIRTDGGENQTLTQQTVRKAAIRFNKANGRIQRRHLISPTVAEETAFVLFHPSLTWDEEGKYILEVL